MRPRILVLNDNQQTIDQVVALLSAGGYDAVGYRIDQVTLRDVMQVLPQLIIIDGFSDAAPQAIDLMQQVWLAPATAASRFLVTSAVSPRLDAVASIFQAKGISVMLKPYRPEQLLARVHDQLPVGSYS